MGNVQAGDNIKNCTDLSPNGTVRGHLSSAALMWSALGGCEVPLFENPVGGGKPSLHPFLHNVLAQQQAWKEPKQKREPFTYPMFVALAHCIRLCICNNGQAFLELEYAIFNWTCLGLFTGSHVAEYGQSRKSSNELFAVVPFLVHAGDWAGTPIAFIWQDFELYDASLIRVNLRQALADPLHPVYLHLRFCFDKSPTNFSICKFKRVPGSFLCPVKSTIMILNRADMLGITADFPVGAFRKPNQAPDEYS